MIGTKERVMHRDIRSPLIIEPSSHERDLAHIAMTNLIAIEERLLDYGALLFRGFAVQCIEDFDRFIGTVTTKRLDYLFGSTPRTSIGNRIFTATEYPAALEIALHNECAYQPEWPLKIAFCCLNPASSGGETPIADMRGVTATLGQGLVDLFEERRVRYVRHYRPHIDISWEEAFQTDSRETVARLCQKYNISFEWIGADTLRTNQLCQGTARHPATSERVFFNQAHLFHSSSLPAEAVNSLAHLFGADQLPRQSYYGDGQEIPTEDLEKVRSAFLRSRLVFSWAAGDILLLDNMQFAHGRRPFKGPRKVIAALMELSSNATTSSDGRTNS